MRCACEKARGIIWKKRRECRRHGVSKLVLLDAIPNVKQENPPRSEHSTYFSIRSGLLRKEHYAELTYDGVECAIFEGNVHGIRLTPVNRARSAKGLNASRAARSAAYGSKISGTKYLS